MKDPQDSALRRLETVYLTWFGAGRAPRAPGTFGTLASLPFIWLLHFYGVPTIAIALLALAMTVLACWCAERAQKRLGLQDPQWIVVDEVVGMLITWACVRPETWVGWLACFVAFRFFDIVKIWPASFFDRKVKNGAGTILDDVVSGFYAGIFVELGSVFLRHSSSNFPSF